MSRATDWPVAEPGPIDGVTVWRIDARLDGPAYRAASALLSDDERARAERFLRSEDRERSVAGRAALRLILAGALGTDPRAVVVRPDAAGKPVLARAHDEELSFNVSHSGAWALIAVAGGARIGVDVELIRPIPDPLSLARHHFAAAEIAALSSLAPQARLPAFYACWTRKEAWLKAFGTGLAYGLARFAVAVPPQPAALLSLDGSAADARRWQLADLPLGPGYAAALAVEGIAARPVLHSLSANRIRAPF